MLRDKTQISGKRFMFTVAYFLQSSVLLTSFISLLSKQDAWITIVITAILFLPIIWVYRTIMVKFPDKNLFQVLELVFGKFWGKVISVGFVWFFLNLSTLNLRDIGVFTKITAMTETPLIVLSLMCIFVVVYAVKKGLTVVCRFSSLFAFIEIGIVILSFILIAEQIKLHNFLPIFYQPFSKYVQSVHVISAIPFGELVALLMITPNIRMHKTNVWKYWFGGFAIGVSTFVLVVCREIAVLGNLVHMFTLPGLMTFRLIHIGTVINRVEILFAVALILLLFFKITFLTYVTVMGIMQIFGVKEYHRFVLITTMIMLPLVTTIFPDQVETVMAAQQVVPFIWSIFEMVIPVLILIVAAVKGLPNGRVQKEKYNKVIIKNSKRVKAAVVP